MSGWESAGAFAGAALASFILVIGTGIVVWRKYAKPYLENRVNPALSTTHATHRAVNDGQIPALMSKVNENHKLATKGIGQVNERLDRGSQRMDRIEDRLDDHNTSVNRRLDQMGERFTGIENTQVTILAELRKEAS